MIRKVQPIITIILGAAIYAFGLTYFVVPHHLFEGGATGITLITFYLFKIPVSVMNLLINIPLFILADIWSENSLLQPFGNHFPLDLACCL